MAETDSKITWNFQRMGGNDQVILTSMAELRHLRELDPKLWGAMSCPAKGLEFDSDAMKLLDQDGDGRIRVPEVLDAVDWVCQRLNDEAPITRPGEGLAVASLRDDTPEGVRMRAAASAVLSHLGKPEDGLVTQADMADIAKGVAAKLFNGDGVLPAHDDLDPEVKEFVEAGLAVVGGAEDASGAPGLTKELGEAFAGALKDWVDWRGALAASELPAGENTEKAYALLQEIAPKVEDFFLRCRLAAFAPQAETPLNADEKLLEALQKETLDKDALSALPLSRISADADLPIAAGLNPLWREKLDAFCALAEPLLPHEEKITYKDWKKVVAAFAPFGDALGTRPAIPAPEAGAFAPAADAAGALDALGEAKAREFLESGVLDKFNQLVEEDITKAEGTSEMADLTKLVLFYLHLNKLLQNFVSFYNFYSLSNDVTFRTGTLYVDGRSCRLCLPVEDVAAHSHMASTSQLCLLYAECTRLDEAGGAPAKRTVMAALTAGSDDYLVEGRNGVFVDIDGNDWDAVITKIIHNPISIRQAVWSPYKRIRQMIGDAIAKYAQAKKAAALATAQKAVPAAAPAAAPQAAGGFDIGKSAGIFAAVGLALGAIGTAIGSIANAVFSLAWWQFPFLIIGIFAVVSGPSAFVAWLKLRKRNLSPVLEASGWACNAQLPINLTLGGKLTQAASLPSNMKRQYNDPLRQDSSNAPFWCVVILVLALVAACVWFWKSGKLASLATSMCQVSQPAATAPAPAAPAAPAPTAAPAPAPAPAPAAPAK